MKYVPTIGLEIHAELKTRTKMFCDCLNDPNEKHANTNICPICTGHPGTLPTINKTAVEHVLKVGMALKGDIPMQSKFDRKNYFYSDLPRGYQISQYDLPLIFGGALNGVRLTRIHLEEDTGRLLHADAGPDARSGRGSSLVDYNRASIPLMELVTEPDMTNADQAAEFARELQLILRYVGASDADMEKGQMRVEANVSIRPEGQKEYGTKVEVKNINSFKAVHDAIEYELKRQEEHVKEGKKVVQETRGWDDVKKITVSQRLKESAHDYRYFPDPDLPPLDMSKFDLGALKLAIPELPKEKRARFVKEFGLNAEQAEVLIQDQDAAEFFEETVSELGSQHVLLAFNYLTSDLFGLLIKAGINIKEAKITPENFAELVEMVGIDKISSRIAKDVLAKMFGTNEDPSDIIEKENLGQVSDTSQLEEVVKKVIAENPNAVADFKKGKANATQFLIGKSMAALKGRGNPGALQEIVKRLLG